MKTPAIVSKFKYISKWVIIKNLPNLFKSKYFRTEVAKNYPYTIQIEPTNKCNLNCIMCIRKEVVKKLTGIPINMSFENFKTILDKIPSAMLISIQGQGEPFLNPDIFRMIKYAKTKGTCVYTTSNATLLNEDICKKIIESGLDCITFSIDGPTKEIYEKIRIGADFNSVMKNIKCLVDMKERYNSDLEINMRVVLSKDNFKYIEKYIDIVNNLKINKISFQKIYHLPVMQEISVNEELKSLWKTIKKMKDKTDTKIEFAVADRWPCHKPWSDLYINVNGDVSPCCTIPMAIMGNILKNSLDDVWNGEKYVAFRRELLKHKPKVCIGEC